MGAKNMYLLHQNGLIIEKVYCFSLIQVQNILGRCPKYTSDQFGKT